MTIEELNKLGEEIEQALKLRTHPIAVKMLEKEQDIPEGALRPRRDNGEHLAQCQAFSLSRRQGLTVAMLKEDHWCVAPPLIYGLVERDTDDKFINMMVNCPSFPYGKYIGVLTAPLQKASFQPDLVMIYAEPAQIRQMMMWIKFSQPGQPLKSEFDPIDSCAYSIIPVMENNDYRITFPDPGEQARAAAREDEVILSVPVAKLETFGNSMRRTQKMEEESVWRHTLMQPDFPRPDFYIEQYRKWGLETEEKK